MHPRDTFNNGFLAGISFPVIFYFLFKGVGWLLTLTLLPGWPGFSDKLSVSVGIVANAIPFSVFTRREWGYAMRGIVTITFILIFSTMYYFRDQLFQ